MIPPRYEAAWQAEITERTAQAIWVLSIIAVLIYAPSTVIDYVLWPDFYWELTPWRAGASMALAFYAAALNWARKHDRFHHPRIWVWVFFGIICVSLDAFTVVVGGADTPYYAGISLLLLALLVSMPWSIKEMLLTIAAIVLQYNAVSLIFDKDINERLYFNANYFFITTSVIGLIWCWAGYQLRQREFLLRRQIEEEKARSEELLLNILPEEVADELKATGRVESRHIPACSILFSDFVGFTSISGRVPPGPLVSSLDKAFSRFDQIMSRWEIEKLKTIGDAYMSAAGVLEPSPDHLVRSILAGLDMLGAVDDEDLTSADGSRWRMRIGIHAGPVVAGVIGRKKFAYDLWGDTVNTASRLESAAEPGTINLATEVYENVQEFFVGVDRGYIPVRGKGPIAMTKISRLRPVFSRDAQGRVPNEKFFTELEAWVLRNHEPAQAEPPRYLSAERLQELETHSPKKDPLRYFAALNREDREGLARLATEVHFKAGQVLIEEGQGLTTLFLLLDGLVGVRLSRVGVDVQVTVLGPGEVVGEASFVSLEPATATVVALEDGAALRFDLAEIQAMTAELPGTAARLLHSLALVLARRLRQANARLFTMGSLPGRDRSLPSDISLPEITRPAPQGLQTAVSHFRSEMHRLEREDPTGSGGLRQPVTEACDTLVEALHDSLSASDPAAVKSGDFLLRETYPWFMRSALFERMQRTVHRDGADPRSVEMMQAFEPQGEDALGQALDAWLLSQPLAVAMRGGQRFVSHFIADRYRARTVNGSLWRAASVESPTAEELLAALETLHRPGDVALTYVSGELESLTNAGHRAREAGVSHTFTLIRERMVEPGALRGPVRLVTQDLIHTEWVAGHLTDEELLALLNELFDLLRPGGVLLVGQLELPPAHRCFVEHVLDWRLPQRDSDGMTSLAEHSAFGGVKPRWFRGEGEYWSYLALEKPSA